MEGKREIENGSEGGEADYQVAKLCIWKGLLSFIGGGDEAEAAAVAGGHRDQSRPQRGERALI